MRVGFIGVGNIGLPMAEQIMGAGYSLVVNDVRTEAAGPLLDAGAVWAGSAGRGRRDVRPGLHLSAWAG